MRTFLFFIVASISFVSPLSTNAQTPGGSDTEIQFNDNGSFGGTSGLKWDNGILRLFEFGSFNEIDGSDEAYGIFASMNSGSLSSDGRGGDFLLQGGSVHVQNEGGYTGLLGGETVIEGGGVGSGGDFATGAGIAFKSGFWDGSDWIGGSMEITPGMGNDQRGYVMFNDPQTGNKANINTSLLTVDHLYSFPDSTGTFGLLESNQTWVGLNTFNAGSNATTTVNFGAAGSGNSKVCFNTKNTTGGNISFYFVGTSMVVENNPCK